MDTLYKLLNEFAVAARSNRDKGDLFERLIVNYLMTDPQYADRLSDVWLWSDWQYRWGGDDGIDIVARERDTGDYWAIQCKFFDGNYTIQKSDIDSFFTASGKRFITDEGEQSFTNRLIVSTTDKWGKQAELALENQIIPVFRLRVQDLAASPIDWDKFSLSNITDIRLRSRKRPLPHQEEALEEAKRGYSTNDRGKLIMACGTGKTFTSLRIAEEITSKNGKVLFLAPSITLVSQTLREWTAESIEPIHSYAVCSDSKVGKENEDIRAHDLAYPATTDSYKLAQAVQRASNDRRTVIFSTYQSIQVVADAQRQGLGEFDLIICDEAHRTTGITLENDDVSDFVKVHQQAIISGKKRLYMTATPRIYNEKSREKAGEKHAILYSMDDESTFGPEFYRLGFGKAVQKDLLAEYKVLIVAVDEERMASLANDFNAYKIDSKKAIDHRFATKIIGSWKGLSKQGLMNVSDEGTEAVIEDTNPMHRAVAFSRSIKDSKAMSETFTELVNLYSRGERNGSEGMVHCSLDHVDGGMNALKRQSALEWLKQDPGEGQCRILSNARCLSEGIDIPSLDAVVFFDTRESIVDIVQSVGRVMRKSRDGNKQYGYIILPVGIPSSKIKDYNSYIENDRQFKSIWKVIKALRAHDESLVDEAEFRKKIQVIVDPTGGKDDGESGGEIQGALDFPELPIEAISEAVYAAIPKKLGDLEYWNDWAKNVAQIAERIIVRIDEMLKLPKARKAFDDFLKGLRDNLNPAVSDIEAVEMLAQHVITRPVFEALFEGYSFTESNPVSRSMQTVITIMDDHAMDSEIESLERFYDNVRQRVQLAKSEKSRQELIKNLYDTFFNNAFPRMAERLGIVYTPVEVVDFIIHSVEFALRKHFNTRLTERGVQILDPFTGTGTFIVRLLQSGLLTPEDITHKYHQELHANELVLLAYYIAAINIESTYRSLKGDSKPFDGMVLTDTFQMAENRDWVDEQTLPENSERVNRQKLQDIRVIIGNPPYSAGQTSANDNNQNINYPTLDTRIRNTYAAQSSATNKNSLYDSYIRAIRWASDRIQDKGIVAFVTNGSFIDGNAADGLRKCLTEEYSSLYVFNLRGNQRTSGELSRKEGGKIFGSGSRTPVAITVLIKDPSYVGISELFYHDIGDYLDREEKLSIIEEFQSIKNLPWKKIEPNANGDWINQRNPEFETFMALGNKQDDSTTTVFSHYSSGVKTNRDAWAYNYSKETVQSNMRQMIANYNFETDRYKQKCLGKNRDQLPPIDSIIDTDPKNISWSRGLKSDAEKGRKYEFEEESIVQSMYRPFSKQWLYFNRRFNDMVYQMPRLFPTPEHKNIVISITGIGANKAFSALVTDCIPNLHMHDTGQCFPLYWYEKIQNTKEEDLVQVEWFDDGQNSNVYKGYIRHEAIPDSTLTEFQQYYKDESITKENIFWYVYGILHSQVYRQRYEADLAKMISRIPFVTEFWEYSRVGYLLGELHLNYETVEPYPLTEQTALLMDEVSYRVTKMAFGKTSGKTDKRTIVFNQDLALHDIPLEAYDYIVNGKSAIEWIMERYTIRIDKDSGIRNDPNNWSSDPRYIVDLIKRIVRISIDSINLINQLPIMPKFPTRTSENIPTI